MAACRFSWSFDKVTPIARTVEDCAAVFNEIYGPDSYDNSVVDLPFNWMPDMTSESYGWDITARILRRRPEESPWGASKACLNTIKSS